MQIYVHPVCEQHWSIAVCCSEFGSVSCSLVCSLCCRSMCLEFVHSDGVLQCVAVGFAQCTAVGFVQYVAVGRGTNVQRWHARESL